MTTKKTAICIIFLSLISILPLQAETKITPVANIDLLGGQYWVSESAPASFGGNLNIFFSPAINFGSGTALLPIYSGSYSGTKDVQELVGGGTLARELQDHSLSFKFVKKLPSQMKLKVSAGYKIEYLKETIDETWGKGLFDYNKTSVGFEFEKPLEALKIRSGLDYYTMAYPNYQALITKPEFETSLDTTTYSELSTQAGINVLDYSTIALFFEGARQFSEGFMGFARYNLALKNFVDQKTVQSSGEFSGTLRADTVHYLAAGASFGTSRVKLGFSDTIQLYDSNQNSFDIANSKYIANYYDFIENSFSPNVVFSLGSGEIPMKLSFFWDIAYRVYGERLAQQADSVYKADKISQTINTTGVSFVYPIAGSLSAKFAANYRDSVSNMKYEKNYKYNYYTLNYFVGINWQL